MFHLYSRLNGLANFITDFFQCQQFCSIFALRNSATEFKNTKHLREYNDNKRTGDYEFFAPRIHFGDYLTENLFKIELKTYQRRVIFVTVKRGEIYYADLSPVIGSEQGGTRPVLIVQNDVGNKFSPTVIAAAITSQRFKTSLPTHIRVNADGCGLAKDSIVLLEQVRTLDKKRLREKMGILDEGDMLRVDRALSVSLGIGAE
jgi:mRNA interferase MazF